MVETPSQVLTWHPTSVPRLRAGCVFFRIRVVADLPIHTNTINKSTICRKTCHTWLLETPSRGLDTALLSEVLRRLLVLNILQSFLFCMPKALNALTAHQNEDFDLKRMKWLQSVRNYPEDSYPPRNDHITYRTDSVLVPWRVVVIVVLRNCSKSIPLSPGWIRWIAVGRHGDLATWVVCFLPKGGERIMKDVDSGELAASISHQSSLLKRIFLSQAGISHFSGGYIFLHVLFYL